MANAPVPAGTTIASAVDALNRRKKTSESTNGERRFATSGASKALLVQLDETIVKRNLAEGELGNLVGKRRLLDAQIDAVRADVDRLEAKAHRTRAAFEILRGDNLPADPDEPWSNDAADGVAPARQPDGSAEVTVGA